MAETGNHKKVRYIHHWYARYPLSPRPSSKPINWNTLYLGIAGVMKDNRSHLLRLPSKLHYRRHETLRFSIKSIAIERGNSAVARNARWMRISVERGRFNVLARFRIGSILASHNMAMEKSASHVRQAVNWF